MFFNESVRFQSGATIEAAETGLTPDLAGGYRLIAEATEEWYNLREKMMRLEHHALVNESADAGQALLNEGSNEFFNKISAFFKKIWARITEMFKKFTVWFNNLIMNDKEFLKKYEKALLGKSTYTGFEWKGYNWNNAVLDGAFGKEVDAECTAALMDAAKKVSANTDGKEVEKLRSKVNDGSYFNEVRGKLCGGGKVEAGEFGKKLKDHFRGGEDQKEFEAKDVKLNAFIAIVRDADKSVKAVEATKKALDKFYEAIAKHFEQVAKDIDSNITDGETRKIKHSQEFQVNGSGNEREVNSLDGVTSTHNGAGGKKTSDYARGEANAAREFANAQASVARGYSSILTTAFSAQIEAIKDRRSEIRGVLARLVSYKPKSEGFNFNEGAGLLDQF